MEYPMTQFERLLANFEMKKDKKEQATVVKPVEVPKDIVEVENVIYVDFKARKRIYR